MRRAAVALILSLAVALPACSPVAPTATQEALTRCEQMWDELRAAAMADQRLEGDEIDRHVPAHAQAIEVASRRAAREDAAYDITSEAAAAFLAARTATARRETAQRLWIACEQVGAWPDGVPELRP